ncbi:biosynthetic peptidoglycan transglycosylase [Blastococcus brunescens]|uniref:Biosynthetic peptidoglycan transglycosylase n=1 Tax=Blastococcus brunescens TaxID=1564165 RepID=A0ABZ1AXW3_9ACTN|nr:biosynthetic peptidoglycan transglycosylase [Blastococcus sp. BMG 8361]WRL63299.1 biosynthetic peptidoglycan transglycosylase [Blastococcus sp. BMG 8361]
MAVPLAGALVAALLLPWFLGPGLVVRSNADLLAPLPLELGESTPAGMSTVFAADGSPITHFYRHNRTPVPAEAIAEVMKRALVDIEDSRFYEHRGLDVEGTTRALMRNLMAGSVMEGGSTITQQLVKQTLLQTAGTAEERLAATEESIGRKLREARLALALERRYSKTEILTRYLNIVYFGRGAYGVQAAAQRYFGVSAADLTLPQAAMLAGLVQTPANDDPVANPEGRGSGGTRSCSACTRSGTSPTRSWAPISASPSRSPPRTRHATAASTRWWGRSSATTCSGT